MSRKLSERARVWEGSFRALDQPGPLKATEGAGVQSAQRLDSAVAEGQTWPGKA